MDERAAEATVGEAYISGALTALEDAPRTKLFYEVIAEIAEGAKLRAYLPHRVTDAVPAARARGGAVADRRAPARRTAASGLGRRRGAAVHRQPRARAAAAGRGDRRPPARRRARRRGRERGSRRGRAGTALRRRSARSRRPSRAPRRGPGGLRAPRHPGALARRHRPRGGPGHARDEAAPRRRAPPPG